MFFCFFQQFIRIFKYFWVFVCPGQYLKFCYGTYSFKTLCSGVYAIYHRFSYLFTFFFAFLHFLYVFHLYLTEFLRFSRYNRILFHVKHIEKQICSVIKTPDILADLAAYPIGETTTFNKNNLISCSYLDYYIVLIIAFVLIVFVLIVFLITFCFSRCFLLICVLKSFTIF